MNSDSSDLHYSVACLWEIKIKNGANRHDFQVDTERLRDGLRKVGFRELAIEAEHVLLVLPSYHRDTFDRIMVAQAGVEGLALLTADATLSRYKDHAEIVVVR